ncbi:MAG: tripartite tricarboxylate transporter substrate binding protein [Burkholderiaceae bacterium]|nr:tripartite tricarboxylate transporter substrate binding protein [Burkholderiaceae bacterium]
MNRNWLCVLALSLACGAGPAQAQDYPTKPVRIIVPLSPGGSTDAVLRVLAPKLSEALGQTVLIENRPGAGGNVGAEAVAKSAPDGYTLLVGTSSSHGVNVSLYPKMPYDAVRDFAPITLIGHVPFILMAHPSLGVRSVSELVQLARAKPGQISYASSGNGTSSHLAMEMLKTMAAVNILHVPYKGTAPANQDLMGGHVSLQFDGVTAALPMLRSGRVVGLGVTSAKRVGAAPDLPPIAEAGFPGFEYTAWVGLLAPAGTPRPVIERLNAEMVKILALPEIRHKLSEAGFEVASSSPEGFGTFIKSEIVKLGKVVKASGAKLD